MPAPVSAPALLLASRSADKVREIRQILASSFAGPILTPDEAGIAQSSAEDDIEAFDTFLQNAHAKADWFMRCAGLPTLADDSGLCVHALNGSPGVHSKRYAGQDGLGGAALDSANNVKLLRELSGVPGPLRTAHYTCAAVLHLPDGRRFSALGTCSGFILERPAGEGGFGYDPLFLDPVSGLSFGQTDPAVKNRSSHRARAFRALAANFPRLQGAADRT
jgi:XTP/dITP diphosphohydrolase